MTTTSVAPAPTFDRAAHCQRIGAHGGAVTVARHGTAHMRAIGTAGAAVTIQRHGVCATCADWCKAKGWHGRRPVSLAADLAAGRVDALSPPRYPTGWLEWSGQPPLRQEEPDWNGSDSPASRRASSPRCPTGHYRTRRAPMAIRRREWRRHGAPDRRHVPGRALRHQHQRRRARVSRAADRRSFRRSNRRRSSLFPAGSPHDRGILRLRKRYA